MNTPFLKTERKSKQLIEFSKSEEKTFRAICFQRRILYARFSNTSIPFGFLDCVIIFALPKNTRKYVRNS